MSKKLMAYGHKGMKVSGQGEKHCDPKDFHEKVKMAPQHAPKMHHKEPAGPYQYPKGQEQSMAPSHKGKALPMKDAPQGVAAPNGGKPMSLPKGGGVGESEV